jgi:tight adherence protein C
VLSCNDGLCLLSSIALSVGLVAGFGLVPVSSGERKTLREKAARFRSALLANQVLRRLLGPFFHRLERRLVLAGRPLNLSVEELILISLAFGAIGALFAYVVLPEAFLGRSATALGAFGVGVIWPSLRLSALYEARAREVRRSMPEMESLISLCLTAGMDFTGALRTVTSLDDRLVARELTLVLKSLEFGMTRRAALALFAERLLVQEVETFCRVVTHAEAKGVSIADALRKEAELGRQRLSVRAEEMATRAGVLLLLPLMLLLVSILLLLIGPLMITGLGF